MPRFGRRRRGDQLEQRNIAQTTISSGGGTLTIRPSWDTQRAVNVQTREALVCAITNAVASDVGDVAAFPIVARQLGTDRDVTDTSPWAYALNVSAGANLTASVLRQHLSLALDYDGQAWMVELGNTVTPLVGGTVEIVAAAPGQHLADGSLALVAGFIVRSSSGRELGRYDQDGMPVSGMAEGRLIRVHSPYPGDPIKAQSYIEQAMSPAELVHFSRATTRALMANAGWPAGLFVLNDPAISNDQAEEYDRRVNSRLTDPNQRGRQFVVKGDVDYKPFTAPSGDGGITALTEQARADVLSVWNMPEARLGRYGGATFDNQRAALAHYYRSTVLRRLGLILSAINQITRAQGYVLEVDTSAVPELNEDATIAAARAAQLYGAGLVTLDEAREIVGLGPTTGGDVFASTATPAPPADTGTQPAGRDAVPFVERASQGPAQPSDSEWNARYDALTGQFEADFASFAQRFHARLFKNVAGALHRHAALETRSGEDPAPYVDPDSLIDVEGRSQELAADLPALLEPQVGAVVSATGEMLGVSFDAGLPVWQGVLAKRVARMVNGSGQVEGWTQTLANDVAESVRAGYAAGESVGQIATRIAQTLDVDPENPKAIGNRALTIARTEVNGLANDTTLAAYDTSGVVSGKRWYTVGDNRTRGSHLEANGQEVALHAKFNVGGVQMDRPHDPSAPAREVVNCRCRTIPVVRSGILD